MFNLKCRRDRRLSVCRSHIHSKYRKQESRKGMGKTSLVCLTCCDPLHATTKTMSNRNTGTLSTLPCCWVRWRFPTANDFGSEIIPASAKEFFIKVWINYLKCSTLSSNHEHLKQRMIVTFSASDHITTQTLTFCRLICLMITGKILVQSDHFLKQTLPLLPMYVLSISF